MGVLIGDARSLPIAAGSVQCVVTSPPYWGLRDYGVPGQLGLESTPDEYAANMVAVFREVWRCLRDDGTLWLNLGDSYAGGGNYRGVNSEATLSAKQRSNGGARGVSPLLSAAGKDWDGCKPKDLVGIPWRVAFALQADGWYLRQDIIWAKPNPMPESVRDRCTKAHEYVFLLTKRPRYYYDAEAIAEPASDAMRAQMAQGYSGNGTKDYEGAGVQNPSSVKARIIERARGKVYTARAYKHPQSAPRGPASNFGLPITRNRRSVWAVNTQPYPEAHFATFPEKLVEPCVLAGTKPGDLVLDPFAGSGTVGAVCRRLARRFVGVELNPAYVDLARARMHAVQPGLALEVA